tara:strand:- start:41 stop:1363 length:1323 start_codon:yes stop_codon:yes gene_type:complete
MRTFKRPMFRKGGNVGDGIMTGIVDRSMHAADPFVGETDQFPKIDVTSGVQDTSGNIDTSLPSEGKGVEYLSEEFSAKPVDIGKPKSVEEYLATLKEGAGEYGGMDPLTSFLLTAGPSVAGATSFADAVNRLQPATKQLISQADAKAKYNRDLRRAAVNLGLQDEQKFEDRRFNLALKMNDREYQKFLTDDERGYLNAVRQDDRVYNKDLIKNTREFELSLLRDKRAYDKLNEEDRREYDLKVADRARAYQKLDEEERREYEERLIKEGRAFELDKIKRAEDFQMKLYDKEQEEAKKYTEKDFLEVYEGDTLQAKNRANFENSKLKTTFIEKFGSNFEGFLNGPNDPQESTMIKKGNNKKVGKVYYDVNTGEAKIYNKKTDGTYGFQVIDIDTYVKPDPPKGSTQAEKDAEIDKRFNYLNPNQKRILKELQENYEDSPSA